MNAFLTGAEIGTLFVADFLMGCVIYRLVEWKWPFQR